jgi:hypothetical protein
MLRTTVVALFLAIVLAPMALAAERLDQTLCLSGTANLLFSDKELTLLTLDYIGVVPAQGAMPPGTMSMHCVGINKIVGGAASFHGICKELDKDADALLSEINGHGGGKGDWHYLGGTGKWHGVEGSGTYEVTDRPKPIEKGTFQQCAHVIGTYTMAKEMKK